MQRLRPRRSRGVAVRLLAASALCFAVGATIAITAAAAPAVAPVVGGLQLTLPGPSGSGLGPLPSVVPSLLPSPQSGLCPTCAGTSTSTSPASGPTAAGPGGGTGSGAPAAPAPGRGGSHPPAAPPSSVGGTGGTAAAPAVISGGATAVGLHIVPPPVESLGVVPGLSFGSAPYLWPLFLLLDVVTAAIAVLVIRKTWSAPVG